MQGARSPRSRSRSISPRRSLSKSPERKSYQRHSKRYDNDYRRRSNSRHRSGGGKHTASTRRSLTPRERRHASDTRSYSRSSYKRYANEEREEKPNRCISVFGLSSHTTQLAIRQVFSKFGPIERIQVAIDSKTGRSRGFCFVYYEHKADAKAAKEVCTGLEIDNRRIRVDYSLTDHRPKH